jgi:hypothetical protein
MTIRFKETKAIPEAARFRQAYNSRSAAIYSIAWVSGLRIGIKKLGCFPQTVPPSQHACRIKTTKTRLAV